MNAPNRVIVGSFCNDWLGKLHTALPSHTLSSASHQVQSSWVFQMRMPKLRANFISQLARGGDSRTQVVTEDS